MTTHRGLNRRLSHLEHQLENTASVGELRHLLAHISAIALTHMNPQTAEAFLDTLLSRANQQAALAFLDQIRDALRQQLTELAG